MLSYRLRLAGAYSAEHDELAKGLLSKYTEYLAGGIANIINILQPEFVCRRK